MSRTKNVVIDALNARNGRDTDFKEVLVDELAQVNNEIEVLMVERHTIKSQLRKVIRQGRHQYGKRFITKYTVKETTVRKHTRKGWTAMRVSK